ncbi:MAG: CinA family protein [bacterium]|nr:CinA family protein [bacterium]
MEIHEKLVETAKKQDITISFVTAGGGVGLYRLFAVPGCSAVMAEARMLYNAHSFETFFGFPLTEKFVSAETADMLAARLAELTGTDLAISLTCAFKTNRERRGSDRGFISIYHNSALYRQEIEAEGDTRESQDLHMSEQVMAITLEYLESL